MKNLATYEPNGYFANQITVAEHHGTHLDAPMHFAKGGWSTAEIPAAALVAPAVVLDLRPYAAADPDALATMEHVSAWETANGRIPEGAAVLLNTGWASRIGDQDAFRNVGPDKQMHMPGFSKEVAEFLLAERSIVGVGIDTLSADRGISQGFEVHHTLTPANKWILEVLANLDNIPPAGAHLFVGVPKHANGSGGPSRVLAVW
jgi:kynurenine formamidase